MRDVHCDYCGNAASLVTGREVYPHRPDLYGKKFYACEPCGAWVGVHEGTTTPLGRLANAGLRKAKMAAHAAFDPLWKSGSMKRRAAYGWLADALGINKNDCHIGMFNEGQCLKVVELVRALTHGDGRCLSRNQPLA